MEKELNIFNTSPVIDRSNVDNLIGHLLTLADASHSDKEQRKGQKDMIRQAVNTWWDILSKEAAVGNMNCVYYTKKGELELIKSKTS